MPFHKEYIDGSPRPLLRGWLHGISACIACPFVYTQWSSLPTPALPGILAICFTLVLSSLVHLVPWSSVSVLEILTRLDKTGILAICGCSFWGPQLLGSEACRPERIVAICTVGIPVSLAILGIACGMGPAVFVACAVALGQTVWHYGTQAHGASFLWHAVVCSLLYASGLALYVSHVGGHQPYWGYHEWMHLVVVIAFVINARGLLLMSQYTEETCLGKESINSTLETAMACAGEFCFW